MDDEQKTTEVDVTSTQGRAKSKRQSGHFTEKQRTIVLVLLLVAGIVFLFWSKHNYTVNFTESLN